MRAAFLIRWSAMVVWSTLLTLLGSVLALSLFGESMPDWMGHGAELVMVVAVFVLICLFESGWQSSESEGPSQRS